VKRLEEENLILRKAVAFSPGGSRDQLDASKNLAIAAAM
jgi:hypothetical protein